MCNFVELADRPIRDKFIAVLHSKLRVRNVSLVGVEHTFFYVPDPVEQLNYVPTVMGWAVYNTIILAIFMWSFTSGRQISQILFFLCVSKCISLRRTKTKVWAQNVHGIHTHKRPMRFRFSAHCVCDV